MGELGTATGIRTTVDLPMALVLDTLVGEDEQRPTRALLESKLPADVVLIELDNAGQEVCLAIPELDPSNEDYVDFLRWLQGLLWTASQIIDVVEKPHNYHEQYAEYLLEGGVDRDAG